MNQQQLHGIQIIIPSFTASQQLRIHNQKEKQENLKKQKSQFQLNLIELRQAAKTFTKLVNVLKSKPNFNYNHSALKQNGQNVIELLAKLSQITQDWAGIQAKDMSVIFDSQCAALKCGQAQMQLNMQAANRKEIQQKIGVYEKMIQDMRQRIVEIEQRLNNFRANPGPNLQDRVTEFTTEILGDYPNDIRPEQIEMVQRLDFEALNYEILLEITATKKSMNELLAPITDLRRQIEDLQKKLVLKQYLDQDLQIQKSQVSKSQQKLSSLESSNRESEQKLNEQIQMEIQERENQLNKSHRSQADKYLKAVEYMMEGFRELLGEEIYQEWKEKLSEMKIKVLERSGNIVFNEPMEMRRFG